ncbi:MAG: hypothetical protein IJ480_01460 [Clostridia bacterium]|nr:hypothetical protein [Clostridia bacterium]
MDIRHTPEEAGRLIRRCEKQFEDSLSTLVEIILQKPENRIITISGPTCSGKTTASAYLCREIVRNGRTAMLFSFDDFFLDRPEEKHLHCSPPDYDTVQALDLEALASVMNGLRKNDPVSVPVYDFTAGKRIGYRRHTPVKDEIRIWEGIQAVYPEVLSMMGSGHTDIFFHVEPPEHFPLTGPELRLCRRIVRDVRCRSASPEFTLFLWQNVRENELRNIYPNLTETCRILNTYMAYEPYILAETVIPLLQRIPESSPYGEAAERYCSILSRYRAPAFDPAAIPAESLYREFIGQN